MFPRFCFPFPLLFSLPFFPTFWELQHIQTLWRKGANASFQNLVCPSGPVVSFVSEIHVGASLPVVSCSSSSKNITISLSFQETERERNGYIFYEGPRDKTKTKTKTTTENMWKRLTAETLAS